MLYRAWPLRTVPTTLTSAVTSVDDGSGATSPRDIADRDSADYDSADRDSADHDITDRDIAGLDIADRDVADKLLLTTNFKVLLVGKWEGSVRHHRWNKVAALCVLPSNRMPYVDTLAPTISENQPTGFVFLARRGSSLGN